MFTSWLGHCRPALALGAAVIVAACEPSYASYTLYRNSVLDAGMRLHIATFDAKDAEAYNRENCQIAADLFAQQPSVKVRYWCEKGRFQR